MRTSSFPNGASEDSMEFIRPDLMGPCQEAITANPVDHRRRNEGRHKQESLPRLKLSDNIHHQR